MSSSIALVFAAILAGCFAQSYIDDGLKQHNSYRAKHQANALELDDDLNEKAAECAEYYAEIGEIDHSCDAKGDAGENLAWAMSSEGSPSESAAMKKAVDGWYKEKQWYNYENPGRSNPPRGKSTGHFTQLVWKASTKLGLASYQDTDSKSTYTVALYSPGGNVKWGGEGDEYKLYKENVKRP